MKKFLNRYAALILTVMLLLTALVVPVSAARSGVYFVTSRSANYANYTAADIPAVCSEIDQYDSLYFNAAGSEEYYFSAIRFYVKEPGASDFRCIHNESVTGYMRWTHCLYQFTKAGVYTVRVELDNKYDDTYYYGERTVTVHEKEASGFDAIKAEFPAGSRWYGSFDGSWQCAGWSRMVFYKYHGYEYWVNNPGGNTVVKKTDSSYIYNGLKVGDLVRYKNNGHSVIITGIGSDGQTVYIADCNSDWNCVIRWDYPMTRDHLAATFTHAYTIE